MSRIRINHQPGDAGWFDEGGQEHVSRAAKNTIGGSLVTEQPFGPSLSVWTANEVERRRKIREARASARDELAS